MGPQRPEEPTPADATVLLLVSADPGTVTGDGLGQAGGYEIRHASDVPTVGDKLDEAVEVVLFDTRLTGGACEDVLTHIADRELDCRCIALVASDASADSVTTDVDAVLELPLVRKEFAEVVELVLRSAAYDRNFRKYYELAARKAAFEAGCEPETLADHRRYRELADRCDRLEARLDELLGELSWREAYAVAFDRLPAPLNTVDG